MTEWQELKDGLPPRGKEYIWFQPAEYRRGKLYMPARQLISSSPPLIRKATHWTFCPENPEAAE